MLLGMVNEVILKQNSKALIPIVSTEYLSPKCSTTFGIVIAPEKERAIDASPKPRPTCTVLFDSSIILNVMVTPSWICAVKTSPTAALICKLNKILSSKRMFLNLIK